MVYAGALLPKSAWVLVGLSAACVEVVQVLCWVLRDGLGVAGWVAGCNCCVSFTSVAMKHTCVSQRGGWG